MTVPIKTHERLISTGLGAGVSPYRPPYRITREATGELIVANAPRCWVDAVPVLVAMGWPLTTKVTVRVVGAPDDQFLHTPLGELLASVPDPTPTPHVAIEAMG